MQRRTAIRQLIFTTGALAFLPSCGHDRGHSSLALKKISCDSDQEKLLAGLCAILIPTTDTPGAKDISAHLFVLMMMDDCYTREDQKKFVNGLAAITVCPPAERESLLHQLEGGLTQDKDLAFFYAAVKQLTIQAYTSSAYFLTNVQVYKLVPGHYYGCVPVAATA